MTMKTLLAAGLLAAVSVSSAFAKDVSGAGATFPAPLYLKWADAYKKATGAAVNYQGVGSAAGRKQIEARTVILRARTSHKRVTGLINAASCSGRW